MREMDRWIRGDSWTGLIFVKIDPNFAIIENECEYSQIRRIKLRIIVKKCSICEYIGNFKLLVYVKKIILRILSFFLINQVSRIFLTFINKI